MIHQILQKILEGFDVVAFCAAVFYALVGMVLILLVNSNERNIASERTPPHYSYFFLIKDNAIRILTSILLIMVFIRFSQDMLGRVVTSWIAFGIGLISDILGKLLQRIAGGLKQKAGDFIDKTFGKEKVES